MTQSRVTGSAKLAASELALENYLEELLEEPGQSESWGDADTSTATRYQLFEVSGLLVAVVASRVCAEIPLPGLRPQVQVPAQPAWLRTAETADAAAIVDTALLVLPDDLAPSSLPLQERCNVLLLLDDGRWGVTVEGATSEETIEAAEVCWRGPQGRRPWLAGTLGSKRCVVLDLDNIQQLLRSTAG